MPRLDEFWDNSTPWTSKLTEYLNQRVEILNIEPTTTRYGHSYLVTLNPLDQSRDTDDPEIAVTSNTVVVKQLDALWDAMQAGEVVFPMRLKLIKTKGQDYSYPMLEDEITS